MVLLFRLIPSKYQALIPSHIDLHTVESVLWRLSVLKLLPSTELDS